MIKKIDFHIKELENMKNYPSDIFYIGDTNLLKNKKIAIVGTRKPNSYTKAFTTKLAQDVIYKNKLKSTTINLNGFII